VVRLEFSVTSSKRSASRSSLEMRSSASDSALSLPLSRRSDLRTVNKSGAEGRSRTDTGLPPPVFEFGGGHHFSSRRICGRTLPYDVPSAFRICGAVLSLTVLGSMSANVSAKSIASPNTKVCKHFT